MTTPHCWDYPEIQKIEERLSKLGIPFPKEIMSRYNEEHRFYHTWDHIENLLKQLEAKGLLDNDVLFLATIFHDAVYDPKALDNEEKSADIFALSYNGNAAIKQEVIQIILDTKTHKPTTELSKIFCEMDMNILKQPLDKLIDYENKIFKEFQCYDWSQYKIGRIHVLKTLQQTNPVEYNLDPLIKYIESRKPNIGVFPGSFNPFHVGHYDILQSAERIFDKVIIARGKNPDKSIELKPMPERIQFRQIETFEGLLTNFINGLEYDVTVVRGLRNATDLQFEDVQYRFNKDLKPDIKVVCLFCDKQYEHVSSSAIRMLEKYDKGHQYLIK